MADEGWIVDWENPDDTALSKKDGTALWNSIFGLLDQKFQQHIDVDKTQKAITRILLRKIVVYMSQGVSKDTVWTIKHAIDKTISEHAYIKPIS